MSIQVSIEGHVATLVLTDPARKNAMGEAMADAFAQALASLDTHALRAIVITGAGDAFSGGGDLAMIEGLTKMTPQESEPFMLRYYDRFLRVRKLGVPLIAAVNGVAVGAGLCLALACDMMIVAEDARLSLNFSRLGLHPGMAATYFAPLRFGAARANELLITGRFFTGADAFAWRAALDAVAKGDVLARAHALAEEVAKASPQTNRALLATLRAQETELDAALAREAAAQAQSYRSEALQEGLRAAREKRAAIF